MGGKTTTSTNTVKIPQEVLDRYNAVNSQAQQVAQNPFQKYGENASDFVAQMNGQQGKGVAGINAVAGMGPSYNNVDKYLNPYIKNVADTTRAQMDQSNDQAQSGALGTAIQSGAFGGDRAGVAAANLSNQNQMAMGSTMANIYNQGYGQAMDANMNDMNRMLGVAGQQLGAGTQMQQTEQAGKDALINQFQQQQGYPFQVAQFLANIAMGTGALSGSTTTSTQPGSFFSDRRLKHDIKEIGKAHNGLPIYTFKYKGDPEEQTHVGFMADEVEQKTPEAVGLDPSGYKTVNYDKATESMGGGVSLSHSGQAFADGGGVSGPYGSKVGQEVGAGTYVPQAYLPVGELMVADPNMAAQSQQSALDVLNSAATAGKNVLSLKDTYNKFNKAYGGVAGDAVQPEKHDDYMSSTLAAQSANASKPELKTAAPAQPQESTFGKILNLASTFVPFIPHANGGVAGGRHGYATDGAVAERTWPEYLDSLGLGSRAMNGIQELATRAGEFAAVPAGATVGLTSKLGGLAAGAMGYPETGNSMMNFGDTAFDYARQADQNLGSSAAERTRRAMVESHSLPESSAAPVSDFRPTLADMRPSPTVPQGGVDAMLAASQTGPQIGASGALGLNLPSDATIARPGDYKADAMRRFMEENPTGVAAPTVAQKPIPRPEGLGAAAAPVAAAPVTPSLQTSVNPSNFFETKILGQESGYRQFDEKGMPLTSPKGAVGIAQVMEGTGPEAAKLAGLPWDRDRWLNDKDYNAALGKAYFNRQYAVYGSLDKAAAAYNAGPGALDSAIDRATALGGSYLDYLPAETQKYVKSTTGIGGNSSGLNPDARLGSPDVIAPSGGVKPYEDRNALGKIVYNEDGTLNKNSMLSLAAGLGDMLSSQSPFLLPSIGAGISGAANTYMNRESQLANIAQTQAETNRTNIIAESERFFTVGPNGAPLVTLLGGGTATLGDYLNDPTLRASGNPEVEAKIRAAAQEKSSSESGTVFSTPMVADALEKERSGSTMNYAAAQAETSNMLQTFGASSEAARASMPSLLNQVKATSGMDTSGVFQAYRSEAVRVANDILRLAGQEPISGDATDAQILQKAGVLRALDMASGSGQSAAQALDMILAVQPNQQLEPETNAKIMASLLMANQRAVDMNGFAREYQNLDGNSTRTTTQAPTAFGNAYARQYIAEEKALEKIVLDGSKPINSDGDTMVSILSGTSLNSQQKNQIVSSFLMKKGMSQAEIANLGDVSRYFGG